jgi:predicted amidohydrolase YtcJ
LLERIDGHASIANQSALNAAGVLAKSFTLTGGDIVEKDGKLTGLLVDNAVELVPIKYQSPSAKQSEKFFLDAQKNCFAVGLTTIDDCGLDYEAVEFIEKMQADKTLKNAFICNAFRFRKKFRLLI